VELDAGNGYIAYGKFDVSDSIAVVINNADKEVALSVPVWEIGITWTDKMTLVFASGFAGKEPEQVIDVAYGRAYVKLPPRSAVIYYKKFNGHPFKKMRLYKGKVHFEGRLNLSGKEV
jgi:hypothetical protein